ASEQPFPKEGIGRSFGSTPVADGHVLARDRDLPDLTGRKAASVLANDLDVDAGQRPADAALSGRDSRWSAGGDAGCFAHPVAVTDLGAELIRKCSIDLRG